VTDHLAARGIDVSAHQSTRLTRTILDEASLAVAMGTEHRQQLTERFDHRAALFSEIAYGTEEPPLDVFEVVPDWETNHEAAVAYGTWVID
jgi:protein-tyrosine-phosphatase